LSGKHERTNSGVIFIVNLQFTITTAGRKVKPDWITIGKLCTEGNAQAEGDRK